MDLLSFVHSIYPTFYRLSVLMKIEHKFLVFIIILRQMYSSHTALLDTINMIFLYIHPL
jgi:hypothetical protein